MNNLKGTKIRSLGQDWHTGQLQLPSNNPFMSIPRIVSLNASIFECDTETDKRVTGHEASARGTLLFLKSRRVDIF